MFKICPQATINLNAIRNNYLKISKVLGKDTICSAVIKNDAYGLGAQRVSQKLYEAGCRNFWVAYLKEAIDIRRVLPFDAKIYFLQGFCVSDIDLLNIYKIIPVINSIEEYNEIKGRNIEFVVHVDTGLSRLGFREDDLYSVLESLKSEKVDCLISHLACSDEKDHRLNAIQKNKFDEILRNVRSVISVKAGISASGAIPLGKDYFYDIARIGAFLYGIKTGGYIMPENVFSLKTKVLQKYEIPPGKSVGYGATYISDKKTKVAVISIGYADGVKRSLSNKGYVLFYDSSGKYYKSPVIGSISMDLIACDVTNIPGECTNTYCEAILLDENYSINEMAQDAGAIPYEILTSVNFKSKRFEIVYISD